MSVALVDGECARSMASGGVLKGVSSRQTKELIGVSTSAIKAVGTKILFRSPAKHVAGKSISILEQVIMGAAFVLHTSSQFTDSAFSNRCQYLCLPRMTGLCHD